MDRAHPHRSLPRRHLLIPPFPPAPNSCKPTRTASRNVQLHADTESLIIAIADAIRAVSVRADARDSLATFLVYILSVHKNANDEELARHLREHVGPQAEEAIMPTAEQLVQEGFERGRTKGRDEGRREGRNEGLREGRDEGRTEGARAVLLKLLRLRFGQVPETCRAAIESADQAQLDTWTERVLTAASLDDIC